MINDTQVFFLLFQDAKDVVNSSKLWKRLQPIMTSSTNSSPSKKADSSSCGQDELSVIKLQKVCFSYVMFPSLTSRSRNPTKTVESDFYPLFPFRKLSKAESYPKDLPHFSPE